MAVVIDLKLRGELRVKNGSMGWERDGNGAVAFFKQNSIFGQGVNVRSRG